MALRLDLDYRRLAACEKNAVFFTGQGKGGSLALARYRTYRRLARDTHDQCAREGF